MRSQFPNRPYTHRRLEWCASAFLFLAACPALARAAQDAAAPGLSSTSSSNATQSSGDGDDTPGLLNEPGFIAKGIDVARDRLGDGSPPEKSGFYPEFSNM